MQRLFRCSSHRRLLSAFIVEPILAVTGGLPNTSSATSVITDDNRLQSASTSLVHVKKTKLIDEQINACDRHESSIEKEDD
jgi:hypothetical protein